jgi:Phage Mu protein F like protein
MARPGARATLDALIKLFSPDIRSAFLAGIQDIVDNAIIGRVIEAIQRGDVQAAFQALGFSPAAMRPLTAAIERAYEQGGILTGQGFPKYLNTSSGRAVFRFDVRNSRAEAYLRDTSSSLITNIEDDIRSNVRTVLTDGMQRGVNPRTVALDIVGRVDPATGIRSGGIVGLTRDQETWVRSVRRRLTGLDGNYFNMELRDKRFDRTVAAAIRDGKPLDAATVEKLVARYKSNALKFRGNAIGRTEALQSLNASEYEAIKQAVQLGAARKQDVIREWDDTGDERTRYSHHHMNGQRVGLDEPFVSPSGARMMHPGDRSLGAPAKEVVLCRCRVKTKIDWLADLN